MSLLNIYHFEFALCQHFLFYMLGYSHHWCSAILESGFVINKVTANSFYLLFDPLSLAKKKEKRHPENYPGIKMFVLFEDEPDWYWNVLGEWKRIQLLDWVPVIWEFREARRWTDQIQDSHSLLSISSYLVWRSFMLSFQAWTVLQFISSLWLSCVRMLDCPPPQKKKWIQSLLRIMNHHQDTMFNSHLE